MSQIVSFVMPAYDIVKQGTHACSSTKEATGKFLLHRSDCFLAKPKIVFGSYENITGLMIF